VADFRGLLAVALAVALVPALMLLDEIREFIAVLAMDSVEE
jgi:ABC-type branched-subunit amino acid transport system ATPase component